MKFFALLTLAALPLALASPVEMPEALQMDPHPAVTETLAAFPHATTPGTTGARTAAWLVAPPAK
ncbi:hypothetical protein TWF281_011748 [Arthrobotrys megalospora]